MAKVDKSTYQPGLFQIGATFDTAKSLWHNASAAQVTWLRVLGPAQPLREAGEHEGFPSLLLFL